jgi:hypothetical protein
MRTKLVLTLVAVVTFAALSAAALAWASQAWAAILLTAVIAMVGLATLAAVQRRTFCIGFAVFAWVYLLLVVVPSWDREPPLVTTEAVLAIHRVVGKPPTFGSGGDDYRLSLRILRTRAVLSTLKRIELAEPLPFSPDIDVIESDKRTMSLAGNPPLGPFLVVGQALWTIVLGLAGGGAACSIRRTDRWLAARGTGR